MIENAILISLSKQIALQRKIDVIANNMANVNTAGYKHDTIMFEEYLMPVAEMTEMKGKDRLLSYVNDTAMYRDYTEGTIEKTDAELDVAIKGDGWLVVQTREGNKYTRNGHLNLNFEGVIVNSDGHPILGDGGPVVIGPGERGISISSDGTISTSQGVKDRLKLVSFKDHSKLKKEGETLFISTEVPAPSTEARIMQGMVEKSNVKPVLELTELIQATRTYVSNAKIMQQAQELRQSAIQTLGRPPQQ
ncbi:MAG: flagellar basal-body rod protein FlgF [Methyloligellaceae bacterium]